MEHQDRFRICIERPRIIEPPTDYTYMRGMGPNGRRYFVLHKGLVIKKFNDSEKMFEELKELRSKENDL